MSKRSRVSQIRAAVQHPHSPRRRALICCVVGAIQL
jgi:hypothetical protein